jgi:hypothetical protein
VSALAWVRLHPVGAHVGRYRMRGNRIGCQGSIYMCACMRPMLRHCDRQIPLPAMCTHECACNYGLERHSRFNKSCLVEREGDRKHVVLTPRQAIRFTQRVLRGYSAGTHRVLSGFSVKGVGAPVGDAGDGCVVGISVNVFPCTSIGRDTETVTRIGVRPA